ncbi:MAG: Uma2 family endonuclease [Thermoleophilaceae bacterium]|nr:Uma2 family endonuclease [Thermoleophilaceae bacterium]
MPVAEPMTAEQFLALPDPGPGWPVSLVDGEVVMNDPTALHNHVQGRLYVALDSWIAEGSGRGCAFLPLDVQMDATNVFKPDISWYAAARAPDPRSPRPYPLPNLAVEIRSPSTWTYDIGAKRVTYEREGLPELWLIDTAAETVLVFRRTEATSPAFDVALELEASDRLTSPQLAGFGVAVGELFPAR